MLFENYRVRRWMRLVKYYKDLIDMTELSLEPREIKINNQRWNQLWKRHNHYARKIYNYQHKRWYAQARKDLKEAHPYGAFYCVPKMMFDLIQRCYEYWNNGYNVWATEDYAAPIREQVTYAWKLASECMAYWENNDLDFPPDKLLELFTYVAEHVRGWSD